MKAISSKSVIIVVLIIGMGTGYVRADRQELLTMISRKQGEFEFKDVTINEALGRIGQFAGVEIVLSDEAEWKLPQGQATRLSASLKGSLSDCLTELLNAFFMRYTVSDDRITIFPREELEHILGRPTTKQIELLEKIYTRRLTFEGVKSSDLILPKTLKELDIVIVPIQYNEELGVFIEKFVVERSLLPTFTQMLDSLGKWYISGINFPGDVAEISIADEVEYREAVLDQVVDISFEGKRADRADVILQRLAGWTGMELIIRKDEPSWLEEKIVVNMQNIKLRQALRNIVSSVYGEIEINVDDNVIEIYGPMVALTSEAASAEPKSAGSSGEGYVGKISIPMGEGESKYYIEFMLRERDLTEELKKLREDKIKEILKKFSKAGDNTLEITFNSQPYTILN